MYDISDDFSEYRLDDYSIDPSWFWTKGPIPNTCLQQLIKQYKIGSSENGIHTGWVPLDAWVLTEGITLFQGLWRHVAEDYLSSEIVTWYMSISSMEHDMCPSMFSRGNGREEDGLSEIKRGYSSIKWKLLNEKELKNYLANHISKKVSLDNMMLSGLTIDRWCNKDLLSYIIKSWWPGVDVEECELPLL